MPTIHLKLSWLWYLPALFIDFMLCYPLLRWTIRRSKGISFDGVTDTGIIAHQLVVLTLWGTCCYFLVTKDNYGEELLVPAVATLGCVMAALYAAQLLITQRDGYPFALAIKVIGPIGSICMNLWKTQAKEQNLYHVFLMINYDAIFFSQGVIDMCYWRKMLKARGKVTETVATPLIILLTILMYSLCSPMSYTNMGHLFFYPLYNDYWL